MYFHEMFWQQRQLVNISEAVTICSWQKMIFTINGVMDKAPEYKNSYLVGLPISAILVWPMATPAGFAAFRNEKVRSFAVKKKYEQTMIFLF